MTCWSSERIELSECRRATPGLTGAWIDSPVPVRIEATHTEERKPLTIVVRWIDFWLGLFGLDVRFRGKWQS